MSLEEPKARASYLRRAERRELIAFLITRQTAEDGESKQELAQKIDGTNPANWTTFEEPGKRYSL